MGRRLPTPTWGREEALEKELSALAAIVEDDNEDCAEDLDVIHAAAEQVQEALITMRESKKKGPSSQKGSQVHTAAR